MKKIKLLITFISFLFSTQLFSQWNTNSVGIYYNQAGKMVSVGSTGNTDVKLNIISDMSTSIFSSNIGASTNDKYGVYSNVAGTNKRSYGIYSDVSSSSGDKYGFFAYVTGNGNKYGVFSECATGFTGNSWAGYFKNGKLELLDGEFILGNSIKKWAVRSILDPRTSINAFTIAPSTEINNYTWDDTKSLVFTDKGYLLIPGKIGIGNLVAEPTRELDVTGDIALTGAIYGKPSNHAFNKLQLYGSANTNAGYVELGDGTPGWNCVKLIALGENGNVQIWADKAVSMVVRSTDVVLGGVANQVDLKVNGKIFTKEVKVSLTDWSDFVFADNYQLMPLKDVDSFIKLNKHLPAIPSEKEVLESGVNVGEMNALLLQKIEELTLYIIKQQKQLDSLEEKVSQMPIIISK